MISIRLNVAQRLLLMRIIEAAVGGKGSIEDGRRVRELWKAIDIGEIEEKVVFAEIKDVELPDGRTVTMRRPGPAALEIKEILVDDKAEAFAARCINTLNGKGELPIMEREFEPLMDAWEARRPNDSSKGGSA